MRKKTWTITKFIHTTTTREVKAETAEGAVRKAEGFTTPSLCHRCSIEIELGEEYGFEVLNPKTNRIVLKSEDHPERDAEARRDLATLAEHFENARLPANIAAILRKYTK